MCNVRYLYYFDELGRLQEARRHDGTPLVAQLTFAYDSSDNRVIKSDVLPSGVANDRHTLYVFNTLELRRTAHTAGTTAAYTVDAASEVPYLVANGIRVGRVVYEGAADGEPRFDATGRRHVFLNVGDHLGSTSIVIDRATGELVERRTYQPYGATESDYRPERWKGFREDYRFTGKEDDVEVGLTYFGKRYLVPALSRWLTPDPLAVHTPGAADLNLYGYIGGAAFKAVDRHGLDADVIIKGTEITVRARIYLYGDGATKQTAQQFQKDTQQAWGKIPQRVKLGLLTELSTGSCGHSQ
jgi:RHS repeat-associated protein